MANNFSQRITRSRARLALQQQALEKAQRHADEGNDTIANQFFDMSQSIQENHELDELDLVNLVVNLSASITADSSFNTATNNNYDNETNNNNRTDNENQNQNITPQNQQIKFKFLK